MNFLVDLELLLTYYFLEDKKILRMLLVVIVTCIVYRTLEFVMIIDKTSQEILKLNLSLEEKIFNLAKEMETLKKSSGELDLVGEEVNSSRNSLSDILGFLQDFLKMESITFNQVIIGTTCTGLFIFSVFVIVHNLGITQTGLIVEKLFGNSIANLKDITKMVIDDGSTTRSSIISFFDESSKLSKALLKAQSEHNLNNVKNILDEMLSHFEILNKGMTSQNIVIRSDTSDIIKSLDSLSIQLKDIKVEFDVLNVKIDFITSVVENLNRSEDALNALSLFG